MESLQERRNHNIRKYSNLQHFNKYSKFDLFLQLDIIIQMPSEQNETTSFLQETKHSDFGRASVISVSSNSSTM